MIHGYNPKTVILDEIETKPPRPPLWHRFTRWLFRLDELEDLERRVDALEQRWAAIEAAAAEEQAPPKRGHEWDVLS